MLKINTDYYYTHFLSQMLIDYDSNPQELHITNLNGKSFSHTFQIEASYPCSRVLSWEQPTDITSLSRRMEEN